MTETTARASSAAEPVPKRPLSRDAAAEFEELYRAQVDAVTAFFARRSADPQTVADLTADTFVQVITSLAGFDPSRGSARAWVFGIARHVYAAHLETRTRQRNKTQRLAGRRELDAEQLDDLLDRIDAQRAGRRLLTELTALSDKDRALVELVDIAGFPANEAAAVLGISAGSARMRLMRVRNRLRGIIGTGDANG
ncbi:MAG TPA: RNA polymerase sigma factor [Pseudonocardiaceae bacterium]|nr:RNA polymerase sigma factor [Pseudonocardiaceae bacterium]